MNKLNRFILLIFLFVFICAQSSLDVAKVKQVKKQVQSGKMSPSEAMKIAKSMGATKSQLQMANEQMQSSKLDSSNVPPSDFNEGSNNVDKTELQITEERNNTEAEESVLTSIQTSTIHFGYNFFGGAPSSFQPVRIGPVDPNYQIGPGDEVVVNLWGDTELRYILGVSREGTIYIDNVGQIIVNGLTLEKLEKKIKKTLSKVYESISPKHGSPSTYLDVTLGKLKPINVFFLGEMKKLGAYQVDSYSTAFTALYNVGGPSIKGSLRDIQIIRNGEVITHFDLYNYLLTGKRVNDLRLQNDDHIFIPPRGKTITLQGKVLRPGIFELKENETLEDLIEYAGGLLTQADISRVQIERLIPFESRTNDVNTSTVLDFDFTEVRSGIIKIDKIELFDQDLVTIFPILDPQLDFVTISGAVHRPGKYALEDGMNINSLIEKSQGFLPEAHLGKADLTRTLSDYNTEHISINLKSSALDTMELKDWDSLHVYSIWDLYKKEHVEISGHVWRSGKYMLHDSMKISDLLFKAGGLDDPYFWKQTYQRRADLLRFNEDQLTTFVIPIKLDSLVYGNESYDLLLNHRDRLIVYSMDVFHNMQTIEIKGEVNKPGKFNLDTNMNIHDLLLRSGGFTKSAYMYKVEVHRVNPYNVTADTLAVVHQIDINPDFLTAFNFPSDFLLQDEDIVIVRKHPDYQFQRTVTIHGEVQFPGSYTLLNKGETLREVIVRCGGLKDEAFIDGIQFTRKGQKIAGDFQNILSGRKKYDIELVEGDEVLIPKRPGFVSTEGMVNNPGIIKFQEGWGLWDYIQAAGGLHRDADKNEVYVYYASGNAKEKNWLINPKIKEGCRIIIGQKEEKEDINWTELASEVSSILASLLTVLFIIDKSN